MPVDMELYSKKAYEEMFKMAKERQKIMAHKHNTIHVEQNQKLGYHTLGIEEHFMDGGDIVISPHFNPKPDFAQPTYGHNHDFFELNYVYKGTLYNTVAEHKVEQDAKKLILMSPKAVHNPYVKDKEAMIFNILIKKGLVETIFINMMQEDEELCKFFVDAVYNINNIKPYIIFNCSESLRDKLHLLIKEYYDGAPYYKTIVTAQLICIFAELAREHNYVAKVDSEPELSIDAVMRYLQQNYKNLTLQQVADHFNYSASYISKLIKKHKQTNFSNIISELKLSQACHFLANSTFSTEYITFLVNYKDVSYFNKIFKKRYGCTPAQFRKKLAS